jgi:hypothetical protein
MQNITSKGFKFTCHCLNSFFCSLQSLLQCRLALSRSLSDSSSSTSSSLAHCSCCCLTGCQQALLLLLLPAGVLSGSSSGLGRCVRGSSGSLGCMLGGSGGSFPWGGGSGQDANRNGSSVTDWQGKLHAGMRVSIT